MRSPTVFALLFVSTLATGCGEEAGGQPEPAKTEREHNVRVVELQRSDLRESVVLSGRVAPVVATDVSSEEMGVVRTIHADKGDVVKKGVPLIELDRDLLRAEMKAAEASKSLREYNAERTKKLYEENSASGQEALMEQTQLEQAVQQFEVARLRYERALIKVPFDGIVAERFVEPGQLVTAGVRVARVVDPFVVKLEGWVTQQEVAWIHEGAPARLSVDGSNVALAASVEWVGVEADPSTGKFPVELRIPNESLVIRPGVVARARVEKRVHENELVIPRDAIVATAKGTVVYVERDGKAEQRPVELGAGQGLMVVATSGLSAGDRVIVRGQRQLSPGSSVRVQEVSQRRDGWLATDPVETKEDDGAPIPESPASSMALEGRP